MNLKNLLVSMAVILALMSMGVKGEAQTMGLAPSGAQSGGAAYVANAVDSDGSNDRLDRGADWTGAVDDNQGIFSVWFRIDGGNSTNRLLLDDNSARFRFFWDDVNRGDFQILNTAAGTVLRDTASDATISSGADWHHILLAWDLAVPTCQLFIDDTADTIGDICSSTGTPDGTISDHQIGALNDGSLQWDGCLSEYYYNQEDFLDLTTVSNRRLFNDGTGGSAGGEPVSLGTNGETPTGNNPVVYLNQVAASWGTNQGDGGNLVITGTFEACSSSPTD